MTSIFAPLALVAGLLSSATVLSAQGPLPDSGPSKTPEIRLTGRVLAGAKAVEGANVHVAWRAVPVEEGYSDLARSTISRKATTDSEGRCSVVVPSWRRVSVWASHGSKVSTFADDIETPAKSVDLELEASSPLKGSFVHGGKSPAKPIRFVLDRIGKSKTSIPLRMQGTSGADGSFEFEQLPKGTWKLRVVADARNLRPRSITLLEHGAANAVELIKGTSQNIVFANRDNSVAGGTAFEVIDHGVHWSGKADAEGRITLHGVRRGHGTDLIVTPPVGAKRYYTLEPGLGDDGGESVVRLLGHESYSVSGHIFGPDSKAAVGATVVICGKIHGAGYAPADFSHVLKTDATGKYSCSTLDKNVFYEVFVDVDGEMQAVGTVDPRPHLFRPKIDDFRIGSRRVEVAVVLPAGGPYDYEVRAYGPKNSADMQQFTLFAQGKGGKWLSPSLLGGEYIIVAFSKTLGFSRIAHAMQTAGSKKGETIKIQLNKPRVIEGRLVNNSRKAMPGLKVALVFEGANFENTASDYGSAISTLILDEYWPAEKFPRDVRTDKDGKFTLTCFEGTGLYDLISSQYEDGQQGAQAPPPSRLTRILSVPNPVELMLR